MNYVNSPVMRLTLSTVPVMSLVAYMIPSAGTKLAVWPAMQHPESDKQLVICSWLRFTVKPIKGASQGQVLMAIIKK